MTHTAHRQPSRLRKVFGLRKKSQNVRNRLLQSPLYQTYVTEPGRPVWSPRSYDRFADEGYAKNVVAYRCISLIATSAATVKWKLFAETEEGRSELTKHPVLRLLKRPNPAISGTEFIEGLLTYKMIAGNAYLLAVGPSEGAPQELYTLRPDRVRVIAGRQHMPMGYEYQVGDKVQKFAVDRVTGKSPLLHFKNFHPLNDWYGLSSIEAASYSIDQHNEAAKWNQALLQHGAKPSGVMTIKNADGSYGNLTDEQFSRLKSQIDEQYMGATNAGRPLLLEGGLEWKEMGLSPKDMDFIESKHSSARDIALAFGVPPQLLGIPGDNTYSNLVEARLSLWEQTLLPMLEHLCGALNHWLIPHFEREGLDLTLTYDTESISALAPRREAVWSRLKDADFLSAEEKRRMLGLSDDLMIR